MKIRFTILLAFSLLFFTQCNKCINREFEDNELNKLSLERVISKLGKETSSTEFKLSYDMTGYKKGLLALVVVKGLNNTLVKEYTWETSECRRTHVWFIKTADGWISASNLTYNPQNGEF